MIQESNSAASAPLAPEDEARASLYALIGRLFYDAPDPILLAEICAAEAASAEEAGPVQQAWRALRLASKSAYPTVVKQEYDTLFVGVGKAEVTPYTSHYVRDTAPDRHLVRLREQLARCGLARRSAASEVEDHVSGVCDVMRLLVAEGRTLDEQRLFFNEFAYPGVMPFLDAIATAASAVFYRQVAEFARAFFEVEKAAFDMEDG